MHAGVLQAAVALEVKGSIRGIAGDVGKPGFPLPAFSHVSVVLSKQAHDSVSSSGCCFPGNGVLLGESL